jgi:hypothetical protein
LVDVLILTLVSVVGPSVEGVSDVAVVEAASAVDVPVVSLVVGGTTAVSVLAVIGTETVGTFAVFTTGDEAAGEAGAGAQAARANASTITIPGIVDLLIQSPYLELGPLATQCSGESGWLKIQFRSER